MPRVVCKQIICGPDLLQALADSAEFAANEVNPRNQDFLKAFAFSTRKLEQCVREYCATPLPPWVLRRLERFCRAEEKTGRALVAAVLMADEDTNGN